VLAGLTRLVRFRLVRNIASLYALRAADQLMPLLVIPYLARVLEPTGWGLVAMAQSLAIYGIITVQYGFEFSGTRAVARERDDAARLSELVAGILATQLLLACLVALAAIAVRLLVPAFEDHPALLWAALGFAVMQGLHPLWYFTGQERVQMIALIGIGAKVVATAAIFVFVHAPEDGWRVLACYGGAALITTVGGYALVVREVRPGGLSVGLIRRTLRLGLSMFVMRIAVMMHTAGNTFLLGLLVAPQQVAIFAAGEKLCRPLAWLLQPINVALLPRLSHLVGESQEDQAQRLAGLALLSVTAIGIGLGVTVALAAPLLVALLFGPGYEGAVTVMRVMAAIIPLAVANAALISQWLIPNGLDRPLNVVIVSSTALNLILALTLAPRFGAPGMAWVTVAVAGYILIGLLWVLYRHDLRPITPGLLRRGFAGLIPERR